MISDNTTIEACFTSEDPDHFFIQDYAEYTDFTNLQEKLNFFYNSKAGIEYGHENPVQPFPFANKLNYKLPLPIAV